MTGPAPPGRGRRILLGAAGVLLLAVGWEVFARSRAFPPALTPTVPEVAAAVGRLAADGTLFGHAAATLGRVLAGLGLATTIAVPLGLLMGRWRPAERFCLPLMSVLMPIPSLAWVPVLILWFGLGNATTVLLVLYAAALPLAYNTWAGARSVSPLWLRAARVMGADRRALFWKITLPGALPFVIAGLRQAFARAWIAVVGGEMFAASAWGLGWVIFDAKEFLATDVMMGALAVIGLLGLAFERAVFGVIEARSVGRWGMVRPGGG